MGFNTSTPWTREIVKGELTENGLSLFCECMFTALGTPYAYTVRLLLGYRSRNSDIAHV
jgi:hypothetical protein